MKKLFFRGVELKGYVAEPVVDLQTCVICGEKIDGEWQFHKHEGEQLAAHVRCVPVEEK